MKETLSVAARSIERYALVGAGAVVTKDVPDYVLVLGVPARLAAWVCECGEKPEFTGDQGTCPACGKRYRRVSDDQVVQEAE